MNRDFSKRINNNGFTLVELIVVLVILSIMASILVPALLGYIDASKREEEINRAKAIYNATQSKLSQLYDQGVMPNVDFNGITNNGTAGFHWKETWTNDILYTAGIKDEERPYICGFYTGNLTQYNSTCKTYLNDGLTALKKGYKIYAFVYVEKADSDPVCFCNGSWDIDRIDFSIENGNNILSIGDDEQIYLSKLCVLYRCLGNPKNNGNAIETSKELSNVYKVIPK